METCEHLALVESLRTANISEVPAIVGRISGYRRWADPRLRSLVQKHRKLQPGKAQRQPRPLPVDRSQLPFLEENLLDASPSELPVLRDAMGPYRGRLTPKLWAVLEAAKTGDDRMLCGAGALARYDPANPKWQTMRKGWPRRSWRLTLFTSACGSMRFAPCRAPDRPLGHDLSRQSPA